MVASNNDESTLVSPRKRPAPSVSTASGLTKRPNSEKSGSSDSGAEDSVANHELILVPPTKRPAPSVSTASGLPERPNSEKSNSSDFEPGDSVTSHELALVPPTEVTVTNNEATNSEDGATKDVKLHLNNVWLQYQNLVRKLEAEKEEKADALEKLNNLQNEIADEKNKVEDLKKRMEETKIDSSKIFDAEKKQKEDALNEVKRLQAELKAEKEAASMNGNKCIICEKKCFMFCGLECLK